MKPRIKCIGTVLWPLFGLVSLCGIACGFSQDDPISTNLKLAQDFADLAFKQQSAWNESSSFKCNVEIWTLSSENADEHTTKVQNLIADRQKNSDRPVTVNSPEEFAKEMRGILGETPIEIWTVSIKDRIRKFKSTYDLKTIERVKAEKMKTNVNQEWLFTDQTVYKYFDQQNSLWVEAIDPFTQAYPFRLDIANFSMSIIGNAAGFIKDFHIESVEGNMIAASLGENSGLSLSIEATLKGFRILKIQFTPKGANQSFERCFLNYSRVGSPMDVPLSVVQIQIINDATEIQLFTLSDVEFGKVTPQQMALKIPVSAKISDQQLPYPVKSE